MPHFVCTLITIYIVILILRAVMSWFPTSPGSALEPVNRVLNAVTEPVVAPVRRVIPPLQAGGIAIDMSFILVIVVLEVLSNVLC
jgi:YggT family protein